MKRILTWGLTNNRAGTEAVISNVVSSLAGEVLFDFLTFETVPNHPMANTGGNRVFVLPNKRTAYPLYEKAIRSFFREHASEYDAIWCNLNILNNIDTLKLGYEYGIPRRILHAHNAGNDGKLHQRVLCTLNKRDIDRYITDRWACSGEAGRYMFGSKSFELVPNAIDIAKYAFDADARKRVRDELCLGNRYVIGAVGRLSEQKNHTFLLDMMKKLVQVRPDVVLVLVGGGELRAALEDRAYQLGISEHVVFAGPRDDVPALLSAFDSYAMPSLFEGLPVSLLEAQVSGLPCVVSDAISEEALISKGAFKVSLTSAIDWAAMFAALPKERFEYDTTLASRYDLGGLGDLMGRLFSDESSTTARYWYAGDALWADPEANVHAGNKARRDVESVLDELSWCRLEVVDREVHDGGRGFAKKVAAHVEAKRGWDKAFEHAGSGDVVLLQFPPVNHTIFLEDVLSKSRNRGVRIIALIHDLELVRSGLGSNVSAATKVRISKEELGPLLQCDAVIAHNDAMRDLLVREYGLDPTRVVVLGIFDYLKKGEVSGTRFRRDAPMVVCGSLRHEKAGYLYSLPEGISLNLYGAGYEGGQEGSCVRYFGAHSPEELVECIEGSYGLVWDGPSANDCLGAYGAYLKVNNPHKTSMYIAAGMPVAIWDEAALAEFVRNKEIGITGSSLEDLSNKAKAVTDEQYSNMRRAAAGEASRLRAGWYTKQAIQQALDIVSGGPNG